MQDTPVAYKRQNLINISVSRDASTSTNSNDLQGIISMPIYLYVKTHNLTGLKYLGKTISSDPHLYQGSGTVWKRHIKKHGYDVTTEILRECNTIEDLKYWGLYYSELWNIVNARDNFGRKIWANLKPEEGDGWASGEYNLMSNLNIRKNIKML